MEAQCKIYGGLIADPNKRYGYAGKFCRCFSTKEYLSGNTPIGVFPSIKLAEAETRNTIIKEIIERIKTMAGEEAFYSGQIFTVEDVIKELERILK